MSSYYNEIDPYAAAWLRNLIAAGHIADGVVDERSIEDVFPDDLREFTQCHFFAGIGVWSYALRRAGWADDRPVWTGSCPCQPFSDAGKGAGFADERHLWPAFFHLIGHHRPAVVFGEQVASSDAMPWLDLVQDDLEGVGYAFGAIPFPSAGVGAPHIRDRLYWVADEPSNRRGQERAHAGRVASGNRAQGRATGLEPGRMLGVVADTHGERAGVIAQAVPEGKSEPCGHGVSGLLGNAGNEGLALGVGFPGILGESFGTDAGQAAVGADVHAGELADADGGHAGAERQQRGGEQRQQPEDGSAMPTEGAGPVNGFWRVADWLRCLDDRWRPVEPGTFPLAHGAAARMGRLRAYGNAINAEAAIAWIEAYEGVNA